MDRRTNSRFRVRLTELASKPVLGPNGALGNRARFSVEALDGSSNFIHERNAVAGEFLDRCERFKGRVVIVDAPDSPIPAEPDSWLEHIVNRALAQVTL